MNDNVELAQEITTTNVNDNMDHERRARSVSRCHSNRRIR